jgi:lysophospholipase L1-like esterase
MAKYVDNIHGTKVCAFPGINILRLTNKFAKQYVDTNSKYVILHVGTNDITSSLSVDEILSHYNDLVSTIRDNCACQILISSILPRPIDFEKSDSKVKALNKGLIRLCTSRKIQFLRTFKPFLHKGSPRRELFTVRDGLHLNFEGVRKLREFLISSIVRLP